MLLPSRNLHSVLTTTEGIVGLSKKIAYRLHTLREKSGLSQQEVAEKADLSLSLVAKIEQGRKADPRASTLLALAGALGVRAGELIEDLVKPPEGALPKKKGKKKKKPEAQLVGAGVGAGDSFGASLEVAPDALGIPHDEEKPKKKKKKDKAE